MEARERFPYPGLRWKLFGLDINARPKVPGSLALDVGNFSSRLFRVSHVREAAGEVAENNPIYERQSPG